MSDSIKKLVTEYVEISQFIEVTNAVVKEKKKRVKELEPLIMDAMHNVGEELWEIPGKGDIEIKSKTKRGGLSKKFLETQLPTVLNVSTEQAVKTTSELLKRRPEEKVEELKFSMSDVVKEKILASSS